LIIAAGETKSGVRRRGRGKTAVSGRKGSNLNEKTQKKGKSTPQ